MPQVLAPRVRHGREPTEGTYSMLRPPARGLVEVGRPRSSSQVGGRTLKWLKVKVPKYREEERGFYKP